MSSKKKDKGGYTALAKEDDDKKLKELEERVVKKMSALETALGESISAEVNKIKSHIEGANTRSDEGFEKVGKDTNDKLGNMRQELWPKIEEAFSRLAAVDKVAQDIAMKVERDISSALEIERSKREEMNTSLQATIAEAAKAAQEAAERKASEDSAHCLNELEKQVMSLRQDLAAVPPPLNARCETLQGGLNSLAADVSKATDYVGRSVNELSELVQSSKRRLEESLADCLQKSADASQASANDVEVLRRQVLENEISLKKSSLLSENVNCKTLSWRCASFRKRLLKVVQSEASTLTPGIRSPDFSLCALPDMQLELSLTARGVAGEVDAGPKPPLPGAIAPPLPVPSSCTLRVWAPPGLHLVFRVTLGEGPSSTTKRFEYVFGEKPDLPELPEDDQRSFFQVHNFCQLDQAWVRDDDSVQVNFEVLEFKLLPASSKWRDTVPALRSGDAEEEKGDVAAEADATTPPEILARPDEGDPDHIEFVRAATAESLMHERLQRDILVLKNKMVRRVEWKVEGCSRLLEHCEVGKGFDSPVFSAAGLERLQFHFYPRGHEVSASGATPACGVFISGPGRGVSLRGMMWVGGNNKGVEHRFQRRGDLGGRARFCPLESQLDCDDSVVIALDINEVEHELPEHNQTLMLREARNAGGSETTGPSVSKMSTTSSMTSPAHTGAKGMIRMKREDPTKTEELVKSITLPTLNARTMSQMSLGMSKSRRSVDF